MNIQQLMQQAQKMQRQMKENQVKMEGTDFAGVAAGGAVGVIMNGLYVVKSVTIQPDLLDKDEVELLQDAIVIAINDAKNKVDAANKNSLGAMSGALNGLM
ncbi:MAG: YbaB/EbfC family nucleoid-associated protein [Rickettsiales bacterium]|jgi:DNA-binding YbaB/EbfC family protein|nr:YbaB/EbfC family nucleoid-associated protein [Rickettsiales bacterium]